MMNKRMVSFLTDLFLLQQHTADSSSSSSSRGWLLAMKKSKTTEGSSPTYLPQQPQQLQGVVSCSAHRT
jgi:hypothetical protein